MLLFVLRIVPVLDSTQCACSCAGTAGIGVVVLAAAALCLSPCNAVLLAYDQCSSVRD